MGNWTRANVVGSCGCDDVPSLNKALATDFMSDDWGPLCNGGICGLPNFGQEVFDVTGNLGERDYGAGDVAEHLLALRKAAPSLRCVVHVGDDYESSECVATVHCTDDGVHVGSPEISELDEISESQMMAGFLAQLGR